jgi:hypothetical protein
MRKHQQQRILSLLQTIQEAQSSGLYADCQDAVISIIKFIEGIEGEGAKTAILLEKYYELLFAAYNGEVDERVLSNNLSIIYDTVKIDYPNKFEIVFLSYRASMSDSFESIYFAAKADPRCDVYFIPIPFYELSSDGDVIEYYEGAGYYSDDIEITNWQEYNIEKRQPDVIFTNYPYDDEGVNITISADYYSKRLREFCKALIHVPYFVSMLDGVDENYATLPGVYYADRVIVQSEAVRKIYIKRYAKILVNFDKEYDSKKILANVEQKFVALGSPKFDKIINSKHDNYDLPLAWKQLIYKSDGSRKKIILYNTHMFSWINSGEAYFKKISSVFELFKNRDDVVLWWRPHPNTEINFRVWKLDLVEEYLKVVEGYKNEAWGIYDDTTDLHRAIAVSDAYYGDYSSLLSMYSLTKKPALIQSVSCKTEEYNFYNKNNSFFILFNDFVVKDDTIWFVSWQYNALFSMNLNTKAFRYKGSIPSEKESGSFLFSSITVNENYLIFVPHNGKNVVRYDMDNETFITAPIKKTHVRKFFDSHSYDSDIYIIPYLHPALLKYNVETGNISENKDICIELDKFRKNNNDGYFNNNCGVRVGDSLILASEINNIIVEYNIKSDDYKLFHVGDEKNKYWSVAFCNGYYWIIPHKGNILKWNKETGELIEIDIYLYDFKEGSSSNFICFSVFEDNILLFPCTSNMVLKINTKTNEVESFVKLDEREIFNQFAPFVQAKYLCSNIVGEYIYALSLYENCLQKINPKTAEIENIYFDLSDEDYLQIIDKPLFNSISGSVQAPYQVIENSLVSLPHFLNKLCSEVINEEQILTDEINDIVGNIEGTSGVRIYEHVIDLLKNTN